MGGEYLHYGKWGEESRCIEKQIVKVLTISDVIKYLKIPSPDVLSMDIQGIEYEILKNSLKELDNLKAVIIESDFFEMYSEQGLFDSQFSILEKYSFRFVQFFNFSFWHPGPLVGKGLATFTESLFLKYFVKEKIEGKGRKFMLFSEANPEELWLLALIYFAYSRFNYFYTIFDYLDHKHNDLFNQFQKNGLFKDYYRVYDNIKNNLHKLESIPNYFTKNPPTKRKINNYFIIVFYAITWRIIKIFKLRGLVYRANQIMGISID